MSPFAITFRWPSRARGSRRLRSPSPPADFDRIVWKLEGGLSPSLGDRLVRQDDRLEEILTGLLFRDLRERRPDLPSFGSDLVTADALDILPFEEDPPARAASPPWSVSAYGGEPRSTKFGVPSATPDLTSPREARGVAHEPRSAAQSATVEAPALKEKVCEVPGIAGAVRRNAPGRRRRRGPADLLRTEDVQCIGCHQIGTEGGQVGPPLTKIAEQKTVSISSSRSSCRTRRSPRDGDRPPSNSRRFGRSRPVEKETEAAVTSCSRRPAEGDRERHIKAAKAALSSMPEDLVKQLTKRDLRTWSSSSPASDKPDYFATSGGPSSSIATTVTGLPSTRSPGAFTPVSRILSSILPSTTQASRHLRLEPRQRDDALSEAAQGRRKAAIPWPSPSGGNGPLKGLRSVS